MFPFNDRDFQYPEAGLVTVDLDEIVLVVAAKDEFAEELDLPLVPALGLQFVDVDRAQVFDALGQLLLVEQYLLDTDHQCNSL